MALGLETKGEELKRPMGLLPGGLSGKRERVSRRVLSVLRRALEAGTPEPKKGETGDQESGGKCIPRGSLLTEGTETTCPGTQSPLGTRRKRRRQRRKAYCERRAQTKEGSGLIPAAGGRPSAKGTLEAQASASGGDGAQGEPVAPRPEGVSLSADERRSRDPDIEGLPRRGGPPGHGPSLRPHPALKMRGGKDCRRDANYSPGEHGHSETRVPRNPRQRQGVSPPRITRTEAGQTVTGGTWRRARKPPLWMVSTLLMAMALVATSARRRLPV